MLTFEEFFWKKKINLLQFQAAEPILFAEFSNHYPLMGEKSFDHTKKYWFNGLRRSYPLAEVVKQHAVQAEAISPMAVQGVAVAAAQNIDAGIEKPKFKEDHLAELVDENVSVKEVSLAEEEKEIIETKISTLKPAFKPRFNPKKTEATPESETPVEVEKPVIQPEPKIEEAPLKPAFKPRFNMQNIKKEPVKTVVENEAVTSVQETVVQPETESSKSAHKPQFEMKNLSKPSTE